MESKEKTDELLGRGGKLHNLMEIFSFLLPNDKSWNKNDRSNQSDAKIKRECKSRQIESLPPSEYTRQLLMTTDERIESLTRVRPLANLDSLFHHDSPEYNDFEVIPRILLFQRYEPGNVYNVSLTIRNTGKFSRYLKLACEIDPLFCVTYKGSSTLNIRLAPGMFHTYNVRFSPDDNRDYEYKIRFATDREILDIPVLAIGPRAILDFPDLVVVPETAVKIPAVRTLLVRNLGNRVAVFNTSTSSAHFWLTPSEGIVDEEETIQFFVNFSSNESGFFEDSIFLTYESREVIRIRVQGSAINCNVRLERGSVRMQEETYIGLSISKTLSIFNRSKYIVKYRWMKHRDSKTDDALKKKYEKIFEMLNNAEKARCMDLVHYNICLPETHELVCQRIYADEITLLVNENFLYRNNHFMLSPIDGEIWPQSSVDVTVHFEPNEIGELSSTAYLEVTGREERLALSLSGMAIGPLIKLDTSTIDLRNIFLCSVHNYQVVCTNKGLIPGVLIHKPKRSDFGGNIAVTPRQIKLQPDQYKSFNVSFSSNRTGDFVERVDFIVKESLEVVAVYIKGSVVCPTLRFDKTQLDFGVVALGFTKKQEIIVHNDSSVSVTFNVSVPNDGTETAVTAGDFAREPTKSSLLSSSPREFLITPKGGLLAANCSQIIQISFTPNLARPGETCLRLDMRDTDSLPVTLPITFRAKVATLGVKPEEIDIGAAFLNFPYSRIFSVENNSDVDGYYYFIPETITDSTAMIYSLSTYQGHLAPGCSTPVTLTITTRAMGKQKAIMSMLTLGEKSEKTCCILTCNGQGPVVSVQPTSLDWSNVLLLREQPMILTLMNYAPIPAQFTATLSRKNGSWKLFPTSGELHPGELIVLEVTAFLRDVGKHTDKITITVPNYRTITVLLSAIGIGSCVICEPPIFPTFDMGTLFSHQDIGLPIEVTNHGSRHLRLVFSNTMEMKMLRGQIQIPKYNKFLVEPFSIELPAQSSGKVICNVRSDVCEVVSEQWWLHCFYDGQGKREILGNSNFIAKFVEGSTTLSKKELLFSVNMRTEANKSRQTDEFSITNTSVLNVNVRLSVDQPFGIITDDDRQVQSLKIFLPKLATRRIVVFFSAVAEKGKRYSEEYIGTLKLEYDEHPNADKIKCRASLNYPNVSSLPKEIRLNCPLGCTVVENIFLKNNGPLEVSYKFIWLQDTISIKRESTNQARCADLEESIDSLGIESAEEDLFKCTELLGETRELLMSILADKLLLEEPELEALEILGNEARVVDEINQICSIAPCESIIPSYSSQCISFGLHGTEALILEAQALCEIEGGPAELIKVFAAADEIRFHLDKGRVDFGQQVIFEPNFATIKLENCSNIELIYDVETKDSCDESLKIYPMSAKIAAKSTVTIQLISQAVIPGPFEKSFKLCIKHSMPISIIVEGTAIISQIYVSLPRRNLFKDHPVEFGYHAARLLQNSFQLHDMEEIENGWLLVMKDSSVPSVIDIEMIVERLIAKEFTEENYPFLLERIERTKIESAIPGLFSPDYILDMGYVVVGQTAQASTRVCNYGSRNAQVRLNKTRKTDNHVQHGIHINFTDQTSLMPGEYADLEVTLNPTKLKSSETFAPINHKVYLEVTNGFTLPIIISATVTYPFVTVSPKLLEFGDVLIGECKLLHLIIKNAGLIDCQWEAKLPPIKRNQLDGAFYLQNSADIYSPGQSGSIKIYFKPRKSRYVESRLTVEINRGLEPITVDLRGRGIDYKLKILPRSIHFSSVIPYDISEAKEFTVENIGHRTVELYWPHLKRADLLEDRVIRVLTHYYQVDEILLPPRRPPDSSKLPSELFNFYNSLVDEMALSLAASRKKDQTLPDGGKAENYSEEDVASVNTTRRKRKASKKIIRTTSVTTAISEANLSLSAFSDLELSERRIDLPYDDPDKIETLLHNFIDDLQMQSDFHEKMKDPVKEVFDALKRNSLQKLEQLEESSVPRIKKICLIFHGAPGTEYQSAACKASRVLGLPLLNLNNSISEMIALGNTACSAKLRELIDTKYRDLLLRREHLISEDEPNIIGLEEVNALDLLTRYEYKIDKIISCREKVRHSPVLRTTSSGGKSSAKNTGKSPESPRVKTEEIFLDIDSRLLIELLEQRLSMADASEGFVLQTLNNDFIASNEKTLTLLLNILGNVEYPVFVMFHESVDRKHEMQNATEDNGLEAEALDECFRRILEIDEMSDSEFDTLSSDEKELYREKVLIARNEEALRRRLQFQQRISELRKQEGRTGIVSKDNKGLETSKKSKSFLSRSGQSSEKVIPELLNKKKNAKNASAKSSARKTVPEETEIAVNKTDNSNLETILSILQNWDPSRQGNDSIRKEIAQSKISKNPKRKDHPSTAASKTISEANDKFWIWHVKTTDQRNSKTCDMIFSELSSHRGILNTGHDTLFLEKDKNPRPQVYSVVLSTPRTVKEPHGSTEQKGSYDLFSLKYKTVVNSNGESDEIDRQASPEVIEEPITERFVLEPHQSQKFQIYFNPKDIGLFYDEFPLGIFNSSDSSYRIKVTGSGDIPQLNMVPSCIFEKISAMKKDELNDPTFFTDTQSFDFGSLLLAGKENKAHRKKTSLKFWNTSKINVELEASLMASNWKTFNVEPTQLLIKPEEFGVIEVTASATKFGPNEERLVLLVKNNPSVKVIELRCNGCKLDVDVEGKQISFGKVLLYREINKKLKIRNNSAIPIFWRITPVDSIDSQLKLSSSTGSTKAQSESTVVFGYTAKQVGTMNNAKMNFKVYLNDETDYEESLFTDTITISGETYDVAVDVKSANPIVLGSVRVGTMASATFTIENRGHYDVKYVIEFEKIDNLPSEIDRHLRRKLKDNLHISPLLGILVPNKVTTINVDYLPKDEIRLKETPLLKCNLIDTNNDATIVAECPITVSISAHCAKFRLIPDTEISFGPTSICRNKTLQLCIENIGVFSLKYNLKNAIAPIVSEELSKKKKKEKSPRPATSHKQETSNREAAAPGLRLGPFTLSKIGGIIEPGDTETLQIDCYSETEGRVEERLLVMVENSASEESTGKSILLSVDSCLPNVDFNDFDGIFQDSYVVDDRQDFVCSKEIDSHTIFSRNEQCLYFERVNIHKTHTATVRLYNHSSVPANVTVSLRPDVLSPKNANPEAFALDTVQQLIPSMSSELFSVSFTPSRIETYNGILEAVVELPSHLKKETQNKLSIRLSGEGCVPEIIIIEPLVAKHATTYTIGFGKCLIDETSAKNLSFKNVGKTTAKVIMKIINDPDELYNIRHSEESNLRILSEIRSNSEDSAYEEEQQNIVCTLSTGEIARFFVDFQPKEFGRKNAEIRFLVVDNPYENMVIGLEGDGFQENVVIEGLPLFEISTSGISGKTLKRRSGTAASLAVSNTTISSENSVGTSALIYELDYGTCFVDKMNKINFELINKSGDRNFRFEWQSHANLVFVPSIGHLRYSSSKNIVATFLAPESTIYRRIPIECAISEIEFTAEQENTNAWDDRQLNVEWVEINHEEAKENIFQQETMKKIIVPSSEPIHEIVIGTTRTIKLMLSAIVAYSDFFCPVKEINFKDTLMFQSREYKLNLENPGNVDLIYNWKIDMDAEYPRRLSDSLLHAEALRLRSTQSNDSRPSSRSSGGILYPEPEKRYKDRGHSTNSRRDELVSYFEPMSRDKFNALDLEGTNCPCPSTSDLFSNSANRTQRTTESWIENSDDQPFSINPVRGVIPGGQSTDFTIRFSPPDVFDYKAYLTCRIENLRPNIEQLTIPLMGRSLLPYCHFDIEESDYLSSERRDPNLRFPYLGSGDSELLSEDSITPRVLELRIVGIGESHAKQFYLINPTTENYHFTWKDLSPRGPDDLPYFHCANEEGLAESGKRTNVVFTYYADDLGCFESFWRFSIDRYKLETYFLLVAIVTEPSVKCSNARLKMRPTTLGSEVEDSITLVNGENFQLPFKVLPDSLCSKDQSLEKLLVAPMSGVLEAKGKQVLQINFKPSRVGNFTFQLRCQVKKMKNPLSILISARVVRIMSRVSYNVHYKSRQKIDIHDDCETLLDFGNLNLNKPSALEFEIANVGDVGFHYTWDLGPEYCGTYILTISQKAENVENNSTAICHLELTALQKTIVRNHPVVLKINNGPVYRMVIKASAKHPSVEFSFVKYDFGPRYIRDETSPAYVTQLFVTNNEKTPAIVECHFPENLPHMSVNLEALSRAIAAHSTVTIPIYFRPQDQSRYHENLIFFINDSTVPQPINLKGEGISYKISLENLRDKSIEFGNVIPGKTITRKVGIVNAGRAAVELRFDLVKSFPGYGEYRWRSGSKSGKSRRDQSILRAKIQSPESRKSNVDKSQNEIIPIVGDILSIEPRDIILQANKNTELIVKFKPTKRMSTFVEKIGALADSTIIPLFFIRGSCVDREFRLDRTHLYFGTVVEGCYAETRLVLHNSGDFGAKFKWNIEKLKPHYDLSPVSGYCSPGMDCIFVVVFRPLQLASILESEATIEIEKYSSLKVSCSGACCKIPDSIEVLHFVVPVRSTQTKNVTITNDTNFAWNVYTVLTGEYFHIEGSFIVPSNKTISCSLTYTPLVMNDEKNSHKGRLIVKLPESKPPLVYTLVGVSLPPEVLGKIARQLPAKTKYTELLPVHNWLNKSQSFRCDIELIGDPKTTPVLYSFTGPNRLDVPPNGSRDFRSLFFCYKETTLNFLIKFTNDDNEYQFYEIEYKVSKPEILATIKLTTATRSKTCHFLQIENPLTDRSITFNANCQHRDITIQGVPKVVSAKMTVSVFRILPELILTLQFQDSISDKITVEYSPYISEEAVAKLDITCPELGNFPYELRLKATPAAPEKVISVTAMLGSSTNFPIVINNISKKKTEFAIEVDNSSFTCAKSISVAPDKETTLEVTYEPCDARNVTAILRATSESLGELLFPLIGSYTLPKPQGPFTVLRNSSIGIVFKNVFTITRTFDYLVDSDAFSTATSSEAIKSKQSVTIAVKFRDPNNSSEESDEIKYPVTGKLIVSCVEPNLSQVAWVYYLRGINE